jgi:hypothetical protein
VVLLWKVKSAPAAAALARRASCLVVYERVYECGWCCMCVRRPTSKMRLSYLKGMGLARVWGVSVSGQAIQWPIDTSEPVVYVVSNGCPSATWLARILARSLPSERLCALFLPRLVRMSELHRVLRV